DLRYVPQGHADSLDAGDVQPCVPADRQPQRGMQPVPHDTEQLRSLCLRGLPRQAEDGRQTQGRERVSLRIDGVLRLPPEWKEAMSARGLVAATVAALVTAAAVPAQAQSLDPKPWGRISFFTNTSRAKTVGMPTRSFDEVTLAVTVTYPDLENDGFEYGLDMRRSNYYLNPRPDRLA